jgi:hypothetical protein
MATDALVQLELERLVIQSFTAVDRMDPTLLTPHTDDFSLSLPNMTMTTDQYRGFLEKRMSAEYLTRHLISNTRVTMDNDTEATVSFIATVYRIESGGTDMATDVVDYEDEWVLIDGGWVQRARRIIPTMKMTIMKNEG